jgi:hypothetical protein
MSGFNLKDIEENYSRMSDYELQRIATKDAVGLRPEVLEIIDNELKKRNLKLDLLKGIEAQNKQYTLAEVDQYCEILRKLNCPICDSNSALLNATKTYHVKSFIVVTIKEQKTYIACPHCLDELNGKAMMMTALLGWWGIPFGLIYTFLYLIKNQDAKKFNHADTPNDLMRAITLSKIGEIEVFKSDNSKLKTLIRFLN